MRRPVTVVFVCLGNICRSPTAEGVFRHLVGQAGLSKQFEIDSAGTSAHHVGEGPDRRARAYARTQGVRLEGASRQFVAGDFEDFDYVIAMDKANRADMRPLAHGEDELAKLSLMRDWDPSDEGEQDVPDPYYGGDEGFAEVFAICERSCAGLLAQLRERHGL